MSKRQAPYSNEGPGSKCGRIECNDDRLLIRSSPISLKEMAAVKICLALWYHENLRERKSCTRDGDDSSEYDDDEYPSYNDYDYHRRRDRYLYDYVERRRPGRINEIFSLSSLDGDVKLSVSKLLLPPCLLDVIEKYIRPIRDEMVDWKDYQKSRIFFHLDEKLIYNYLDEIVWKSDGTVHYELTARSMQFSRRLSDIEKYRMMCTYCLEDEIEIAPADLVSNRYIDRLVFDNHPLICYWNCKKRGELDQISTDGFNSVDSRMATLVDNEHAILYFFNELANEDKLDKARMWIQRYGVKYQSMLINNMNDVQQQHIFLDMAVQIIDNYAKNGDLIEYAFHTWTHVRNLVTESQFAQLFVVIVSRIGKPYDESNSCFFELLRNIWTNAADELKQYAMNYGDKAIVYSLLRLTKTNEATNLELLMVMLSDADIGYKANVIQSDLGRNICEWLFINARPSLLDQFIKVCLSNNESALLFKNILLNAETVRDHCVNLCKNRQVYKLDDILASYTPDAKAMADFKASILTFYGGVSMYAVNLDIPMHNWSGILHKSNIDNCKAHENFLSDMLSKAAASVRREVINSPNAIELCELLIRNSRTSSLNYMVNLCLSENESIAFKVRIFEQPSILQFIIDHYVRDDWKEMSEVLANCIPNVDAIAKYKTQLLMHDSIRSICLRKFSYGVTKGCKFLWGFLSNASPDMKRELIYSPAIQRLMEDMIMCSHLDPLVFFIRLCLPNDEAIELKRQLIMTSVAKTHFLNLFQGEELTELNNFMAKLLPRNDVMNFKQKVLTSSAGVTMCLRKFAPLTYKMLSDNIEAMFPNGIAAAVKRKIFMSGHAINRYHKWFQIGCCTEITNAVEYLFRDENDLNDVKQKVFDFYRDKSMKEIFSTFKENQFQQIILWCAGSSENVVQYKCSLPLHNIFIEMLQDSVFITYSRLLTQCKFKYPTSFQELDRFLRWYFVTLEEVKKFKIDQIYGYLKIGMVVTLLRKTDKTYLTKVMNWFLDNDRVQIQKFKNTFSNFSF